MRRLTAPLGVLTLVLALAACGNEDGNDSADEAAGGLDAVTVSGEAGSEPKVTIDEKIEADELESETLDEGDGDVVEKGDSAVIQVWIGNGFTQEEAYNSWSSDGAVAVTADDSQLNKSIYEGVVDHKVGSRTLVVAPAKDAFGEGGQPQMGLGNTDSVVFVVDIVSGVLDGPDGAEQKPAASVPSVVEKSGMPTGFDFSGTPKQAPGELKVTYLVKGDGEKITKGSHATMNYLGVVQGSKTPFDESYTKTPFSTAIGEGAVIQGWDKGLVGVPVGSRVVLQIPSEQAYGKTGSGETIPPNSDLVFVVDVLATY